MSIDNSKWNGRSASSTIKRDGRRPWRQGGGGKRQRGQRETKEKSHPHFLAFGRRAEISSSCWRCVCNELLLIRQLFSFCSSSGHPSTLGELASTLARRSFLAQITNRRISSFSFEKCRQREKPRPPWQRRQMSTEEKVTETEEQADEFLISFAEAGRDVRDDKGKRLSSYVSHVTPPTNYIS